MTKVLREVQDHAAFADERLLRSLLLDEVPRSSEWNRSPWIRSRSESSQGRCLASSTRGSSGNTLHGHISIALREAGIIASDVEVETDS